MRYLYLGDRHSDPRLRRVGLEPVRDRRGRCVVGASKALVRELGGRRHVVLRRRLRVVNAWLLEEHGAAFVGQAPSGRGDPRRPVTGRIGARLMRLCGGLSLRDYCLLFGRLNLLAEFPGKNGKGDAFPIDEARRRAAWISRSLGGRRVVLLGGGVARAFGLSRPRLLEWTRIQDFEAAVVPHPSGINRWWNDPENEAKAAEFLTRTAEEERCRRS